MTRTPDRDALDYIEGGFLILARLFFESRLWNGLRSTHIVVALACLYLAVWKDTEVIIDHGERLRLQRGQFWFTQNRLAKKCPKDITRRVIRRAIANLQRIGFLGIKAGQHFSVGTICNYDLYQDLRRYLGQERAKGGPRAGQHKNTIGIQAVIASNAEFLPWIKALTERWNSEIASSPATVELPKVTWDTHGDLPLGEGRLEHLHARYKEPMFTLNLDRLFAAILASDLLSGRLKAVRTGKYRNFAATFDWITTNSDNYRFVLEGRYQAGTFETTPSGLRTSGTKYARHIEGQKGGKGGKGNGGLFKGDH